MSTQHRRPATDTALDERVVSVLAAAAAPSEPGPLPGEAHALAAFRASRYATRRPSMLSSLSTVKATAAAALGAGILLTGSVGAAAAGALPAEAQDSASAVLAKVGVSVPTAAEAAGAQPDDPEAVEDGGEHSKPENTSKDHGQTVSDVARSDGTSGRDKGEAVSEEASSKRQSVEHRGDGAGSHSRADEHKQSGPGRQDAPGDRAEDAKADGTATADEARERAEDASADGSAETGSKTDDPSTEGSARRP